MGMTRIKTVVSLAVAAAAAASFVAASPAEAGGKPAGGGTSSLSLVMVNDASGNGTPDFGDTISFTISTTATAYPYVNATCSQSGTMVWGADAGFYPSYPWPWSRNMTMSGQAWAGGAADCSAVLYYNTKRGTTVLATLTFAAGA